jgi:hypothetical protein
VLYLVDACSGGLAFGAIWIALTAYLLQKREHAGVIDTKVFELHTGSGKGIVPVIKIL